MLAFEPPVQQALHPADRGMMSRPHESAEGPRELAPAKSAEGCDMFQTAIPVMQVSGSTRAEEFYCQRLGFTLLSSWRPDETKDDPRYMTLARDGARLHVHSFQSGTAGAAAVYVFVDDVDSLYAELLSNGVPVSGPPIDQSWGTREIVVRDPDRNVVTFGQSRSRSKE
jgi:uncharacterized glyoxalase superfamily protein PhnB